MSDQLRIIRREDTIIIKEYIHAIRRTNSRFATFIDTLKDLGQLFFIGGTVRDIINGKKTDDIDIIVKVKKEKLDELIMGKYSSRKNTFGGYKLIFDKIVVDVWSIENNWAFRENILQKNIKNLAKGTFFNFDSLIYDFNRNKLHCHYYNHSIRRNVLDIISDKDDYLHSSQQPELNITKAIIINRKFKLQFSDRLLEYIRDFFDKDAEALTKVIHCSKKQYRIRIMNDLDIDYFSTLVTKHGVR